MRVGPLLLLFGVGGCGGSAPAVVPPVEPPPPVGTAHDPAGCGTISGRVTWAGDLPTAADFLYGTPKPDGTFDTVMMPNPNRPAIDPTTRAVGGAVVSLTGINPARAKPWDLSPAAVTFAGRQLVVTQGGRAGRSGFVRRGDAVTVESGEPVFHLLRARGATFFGLPLPDPHRPTTKAFTRPGRVELSSGAGLYWASADLFVADLPYLAHTTADGRFAFTGVPAGPVNVAVWLPGWGVAAKERDPESGLIARQTYTPPVGAGVSVTVTAGQQVTGDVVLK